MFGLKRIKRNVINSNADRSNVSYMDYFRQRIEDTADDIGDNRILEEEDAIAREAGEINDGDIVENENANDEIEGDKNAFQILPNVDGYGEA